MDECARGRSARSARKGAAALALTAVLAAGGCTLGTIEQGAKIDPAVAAKIHVGMKKSEVLGLLGPPQEFRRPELLDVLFSDVSQKSSVDASAAIFNDVFSYRYSHGDVKVVSIIVFTWMSADIKNDELVVFFDQSDQVKYFAWRPES